MYLNKKNKVIIYILVIVYLLPIYSVSAEKCPIKDWVHDILIKYKEQLNAKTSEISKSIKKEKNESWIIGWLKKDVKKIQRDTIRVWKSISKIFNGWWNWWWYDHYWRFYVSMPLSEVHIPYEVRRDHDFIKKEWEWLAKYQKALIKRWNFDQANEITILINNNNLLLNCYRRQVIDWSCKQASLLHTPIPDINFIDDKKFTSIYTDTLIDKCSWDMWDKIVKKFDSIQKTLTWNWKAFKDWIDARKMIKWDMPAWTEKKLLKAELQRQWLSPDAINKMTDDLDKMNKCLENPKKTWLECMKENNPISNTIGGITKSYEQMKSWFIKQMDKIDKKMQKNRGSDIRQSVLKESPVYKTLDLIEKNSKKDWTEWEIEDLFNFNEALIQVPDWSTKKLEWKIVNSHILLNQAIKILNDTIKISRKVCNAQHRWAWTCK